MLDQVNVQHATLTEDEDEDESDNAESGRGSGHFDSSVLFCTVLYCPQVNSHSNW